MAERPILFNGPMVRALLDGSKMQTRRVVKPQPQMVTEKHATLWEGDPAVLLQLMQQTGKYCPYGQPGDRLWVRETFVQGWETTDGNPDQFNEDDTEKPKQTWYRATETGLGWDNGDGIVNTPWKPSIHMPRTASRINLDIVSVRVERLQDISETDAKAEGAKFHDGHGIGHSGWRHDYKDVHINARSSYARLWQEINGPSSWDLNPWVWVVEFKRVTE